MESFEERQIGDVTVQIDRTLCIGSGSCMTVAPEIFELDEKNIITFQEETPDIEKERLVEACELCPVDALIATTKKEGQLVP